MLCHLKGQCLASPLQKESLFIPYLNRPRQHKEPDLYRPLLTRLLLLKPPQAYCDIYTVISYTDIAVRGQTRRLILDSSRKTGPSAGTNVAICARL